MRKKGFTLIELMVVIAIIAILSGLIMVYLSGAREAAEDATRMTAVTQLRSLALSEGFEGEELSEVKGEAAKIICEYGKPEDTKLSGCESKGVLIVDINKEEGKGCISIKLNETDEEGNKYFCVDRSLSAGKYGSNEHICGSGEGICKAD